MTTVPKVGGSNPLQAQMFFLLLACFCAFFFSGQLGEQVASGTVPSYSAERKPQFGRGNLSYIYPLSRVLPSSPAAACSL